MSSANSHCSSGLGSNWNNNFCTELQITTDNYFQHCRLCILQAKQFVIARLCFCSLLANVSNSVHMTAGQLSEHDRNFKTLIIILNLSKISLLLTHKTGVTGLSYHQEEMGVQHCQECR